MSVTSVDVVQVVTEVWAPSLELSLHPTDTETGAREHTSVLLATGDWNGCIVVAATHSFARAVASKMFGLPRDHVGRADADDAIGELSNVVGGNIKSLLSDGAVDLGLPRTDDRWDGDGQVLARTVLAAAPGFEVSIHVVEGVGAAA